MSKKELWEKAQMKTFTLWANHHLSKWGTDPDQRPTFEWDKIDGVEIIKLCEVISNEKLGKYNKKPKMKLHKVGNVGQAFKFIEGKGIPLIGMTPEGLVEGRLKLVAGFLWILILRYSVQEYMADDVNESGKKMSAKQAMFKWVADTTGMPVKNVKSFTDGQVLTALVNALCPDTLPVDEGRAASDPEGYIQDAFDAADNTLAVPKLLAANDLVEERVDDLSMLTYLSAFRQYESEQKDGGGAATPAVDAPAVEASPPPVAEEEAAKNPLFGIPVADAQARAADRPCVSVVEDCVSVLDKTGLSTEGVLSSDKDAAALKEKYDASDADGSAFLAQERDMATVGALLQCYFADLPDSVFADQAEGMEATASALPADGAGGSQALAPHVDALPAPNKAVLDQYVGVCQRVVSVGAPQNDRDVLVGRISTALKCSLPLAAALLDHWRTPVVGVPLIQALYGYDDAVRRSPPELVADCVAWIEAKGQGEDDLFSKDGDEAAVAAHRGRYNARADDAGTALAAEEDAHTVAALLKDFLASIPQGGVLGDPKDAFDAAAASGDVDELKKAIEDLDEANQDVLRAIVPMLKKVSADAASLAPAFQSSPAVVAALLGAADVLYPQPLWGAPLADACEHGDGEHTAVPSIVADALAWIDDKGLEVDGLFEQPGEDAAVQGHKERYESAAPDAPSALKNEGDAHTVAALLKDYLAALPSGGVLQEDVKQEFEAADLPVEDLVAKLDPCNQDLLKALIPALGRVAIASGDMDVPRLATAMSGPMQTTPEVVERLLASDAFPQPLFGAPLKVACAHTGEDNPVPVLVEDASDCLQAKGAGIPGLFTQPGDADAVAAHRDRYDSKDDRASPSLAQEGDPHTVAALLKEYLAELPGGALGDALPAFEDAAGKGGSDALADAMRKLDKRNEDLVKAVVPLLALTCNDADSGVSVEDMAAAMAPSMQASPEVVRALIEASGDLFPQPLFGTPLNVACMHTGEKLAVPCVVDECVKNVDSNLGRDHLFKEGGDEEEVQALKAAYDDHRPGVSAKTDPSVAAAVLLAYVDELPDVLFADKLTACEDAAAAGDKKALKEELTTLPQQNQDTLNKFVGCLQRVEAMREDNHMSVEDLVPLVAPVLRTSDVLARLLITEWDDLTSTGIFGAPIQEALTRKLMKRKIPQVVEDCLAYLDREGIDDEDIFKAPGDDAKVAEHQGRYDARDEDSKKALDAEEDPHTVAALLKKYLDELPDGGILGGAAEDLNAALTLEDPERTDALERACDDLPKDKKNTLDAVLACLARAADEDSNRMDTAALAEAMASSLKCSPEALAALIDKTSQFVEGKLFGELIAKARFSGGKKRAIPTPLEDTIKYLDNTGLSVPNLLGPGTADNDEEGDPAAAAAAAAAAGDGLSPEQQEAVMAYKAQYDADGKSTMIDISACEDPAVIVGLLKLYIGDLPAGDLFCNKVDKFEKAAGQEKGKDRRSGLANATKKMKKPQRSALQAVVGFLARVKQHEADTNMTVEDISEAMAPSMGASPTLVKELILAFLYVFPTAQVAMTFSLDEQPDESLAASARETMKKQGLAYNEDRKEAMLEAFKANFEKLSMDQRSIFNGISGDVDSSLDFILSVIAHDKE